MRKKKAFSLTALVLIAGFLIVGRLLLAPRADEIYFYCGAGLRPVVDEIVEMFAKETGISVRVDYNASNLLLGRIRASEKGDLFMPGDMYYIEKAAALGLISESWKVAAFVPVIMVGKDNPLNIRTLADLTQGGLKLGLADERTAAIGRTARLLFKQNGIPLEAVGKNLVYDSVTVHELAVAVKLGHIDAAIVWEPVALLYKETDIVRIPPGKNIVVPVPIAVLTSTQREKEARQFARFVFSEQSMAVFARHQYGQWRDYCEKE